MLTFRCAADIICVKRATLIIGAESESPYFAVGRTADCVFETETDEDRNWTDESRVFCLVPGVCVYMMLEPLAGFFVCVPKTG